MTLGQTNKPTACINGCDDSRKAISDLQYISVNVLNGLILSGKQQTHSNQSFMPQEVNTTFIPFLQLTEKIIINGAPMCFLAMSLKRYCS